MRTPFAVRRTEAVRWRVLIVGFWLLAATAGADEANIRVVRDVVYAKRASGDLRADLYLPGNNSQPRPGVLMIHGGAWAAGMKTHSAWHARQLAKAGFAAVAIDYRLAPVHPFPAQLEDCREALQWLAINGSQYAIERNRLAAFGYSAGGHLACLLGNCEADKVIAEAAETNGTDPDNSLETATFGKPRLRAIVAGGAPCEFRTEPLDSRRLAFWLGGPRREVPKLYDLASPARYASANAPPTFFFHGVEDRVVPASDPVRFHQRLKQLGVATEMLLIPEAGHVGTYANRHAMAEAIEFLREHVSAFQSE